MPQDCRRLSNLFGLSMLQSSLAEAIDQPAFARS
jgi:hypothetical protein